MQFESSTQIEDKNRALNLFGYLEVPRAFEKVATVICNKAEARLQWAEEEVRNEEMGSVI